MPFLRSALYAAWKYSNVVCNTIAIGAARASFARASGCPAQGAFLPWLVLRGTAALVQASSYTGYLWRNLYKPL